MEDFKVSKLTQRVYHIVDPTGVASFLALGDDRALLVDTGTGYGNLAGVVKGLTALPVTVLLTHYHGDHSGGAFPFGPEVYIAPEDLPYAERDAWEMREGYARMSLPPEAVFDAARMPPSYTGPFKPLAAGQVFALGGLTLETIPVPGHTKGSVCVLFRENRAILFGDACNINTLLLDETATTIGEYRESLLRLQEREGEWDTVYYSHGPAIGPRECLADNIELCARILAGADDAVEDSFMGRPMLRAAAMGPDYRRLDGRFGNIMYAEEKRR